jgi:selenium metabolism protein YedF
MTSENNNTLIQVTSNGMGTGDEGLGLSLIKNYFKLIVQEEALPKIITFYNAGVKLLVEGSPVIEELKILEDKGVKLLACKTCLNHFKLIDKQKVGLAGTMIDIITLHKKASRVINL